MASTVGGPEVAGVVDAAGSDDVGNTTSSPPRPPHAAATNTKAAATPADTNLTAPKLAVAFHGKMCRMTHRRMPALIVLLLALVSCGGDGGKPASVQPTTVPSTTPAPTSSITDVPTTTTTPAPWAAAALPVAQVPAVVIEEWGRSQTRTDCPPVMFAALGDGAGGVPRRADFGAMGWAVAWDKPGTPGQLPNGQSSPTAGRSTFGIAGVGGLGASAFQWPYRIEWADGSSAGYGVEGGAAVEDGSTTKWLAYLRLAHHECLYNVWSNLGRGHLEYLLGQLRAVEGHPL